MKTEMWTWMRVQFFRFWTALVVLGAYGYFWLNTPEVEENGQHPERKGLRNALISLGRPNRVDSR